MSKLRESLDINDEDIKKAEEILNRGSIDSEAISFDENSKKIIKEKISCFVQACPGSGKTTTVVAKLAILADKLPHNYEGICVLSHTNVAKDEIKKRLNDKSDRLFKYPNFIGTIQSFVDTYLAIPAMVEKYNVRVEDIDDSRFAYRLKQNLYVGTVRFLEKRNVNFEKIDFSFDDIEKLSNFNDLTKFSPKEARHYQILYDKSKKIKKEGTLTFNDAFALANWYINKHPEISDAISKRFPYVIIDEVQDTSENSLKILTTVFKNSIIHYFGDNNQNLYNPDFDVLKEIQKKDNTIKLLHINNTYRLSPNICNLSNHVCRNRPDDEYKLTAGKKYICENQLECKKCRNCQNTIILYNDETITQVLPLYAQIIKSQKELKPEMKDCYKFVGQVGTIPDEPKTKKGVIKIVLPNYYPSFNKNINSKTVKYTSCDNFKTILYYAEKYIKENNFKEAKNVLLRAIYKLANCQGIKEIKSISDIKIYFKKKNNIEVLNLFLFKCCDDIKNNNLNFEEASKSLVRLINKINSIDLTEKSKDFLQNEEVIEASKPTTKSCNNIYTDEKTGIKIEVCTIASVKGETHDATLLAETYKGSQDLTLFLKLIANKTSAKIILENKRLSNLYVAMTRPKHLLCLAMHENGFNDSLAADLKNLGWKIDKSLLTEK